MKKKEKLNVANIKASKSKKINLYGLIFLLIFVVVIVTLTFTITTKFSNRVFKNIYLEDINVSKYTATELENLINKWCDEAKKESKVIIRQGNEEIDSINAADIEFEIDIEKTKKEVYSYGRDKNIIKNNLAVIGLLFNKKEFSLKYKVNGEKLDEKAKVIQNCLKDAVLNDQWELDENNFQLIITKGKKGASIDIEQFKKDILNLLKSRNIKEYELKTMSVDSKTIDINELYEAVYRKPVNAEISKENGKTKFIREVYGLDFDKSDLESKLKSLVEPGQVLKYKLDASAPLTKFEDITWTKYDDLLSSVTTYYAVENKNKANNINVSSTYINEKIIMPGETFSFNSAVGEPTADKGYVMGGVYMGSSIVDGMGGGICQTVSTLYDAVLYANLEIVSRSQHAMSVKYVRPSLDATMYYPYIDFKFKNNRNFPIKIKTAFSWAGNLNISILGTKEDTDVEIELESVTLSEEPFTTKTVVDNTLESGKQYVKQIGVNGFTSEAYKITKKDGVEIKRELISRDRYKPIEKIVIVGPTEKVEEPVE